MKEKKLLSKEQWLKEENKNLKEKKDSGYSELCDFIITGKTKKENK